MTVSYTSQVTSSRGIGSFLKLLARWRGSIYKLIWTDLLMYIILYYALSFTYRFVLNDKSRWYFEQVVTYFSKYGTLIPLSFVLGFYVNIVMTRWWNQFTTIPYPDNLALLVSAAVRGNDERARLIRRTIVRYVCLCFAITLTLISPKVKKRFPSLDHLVEAGLMMKDEKKIMDELKEEFPNYPYFWLPLAWASNIVTRARHEGLIRSDISVSGILQEINVFRTKCGTLLDFDWISIPLVYTQVVTLAVYTYFLASIIGQQYISTKNEIDLYFPIMAIVEFFFYMGWLRVAEVLINPFGEDDDDFDVVWMIDRHVQVTYLIVDKMHEEHPKLMQDQYWFNLAPQKLPFTVASEKYIDDCPQPSTSTMNITAIDAEILPPGVRRRTKDSSESFHRKTPSRMRKIFGSRRRNEEEAISMKSLSKLTSVNTDNTTYEVNETRTQPEIFNVFDHPRNSPEISTIEEGEVIDFEKLKKLRQLLLKQKIIKYMELSKEHTNDEEEQILDDIINCQFGKRL